MPERCAPATQTTLLPANESFEYFRFKKPANSYVELINTIGLHRVNPFWKEQSLRQQFKFPRLPSFIRSSGITLPPVIRPCLDYHGRALVASDSRLLASQTHFSYENRVGTVRANERLVRHLFPTKRSIKLSLNRKLPIGPSGRRSYSSICISIKTIEFPVGRTTLCMLLVIAGDVAPQCRAAKIRCG